MTFDIVESKFLATEEKGEVSSLLLRPVNATWLLVLGHGAGANMRHQNLDNDCRTVGRGRHCHVSLSISLYGTRRWWP